MGGMLQSLFDVSNGVQPTKTLAPMHYIDGLKNATENHSAGNALVKSLQEHFNANPGAMPHEVFETWAQDIHNIPTNALKATGEIIQGQ